MNHLNLIITGLITLSIAILISFFLQEKPTKETTFSYFNVEKAIEITAIDELKLSTDPKKSAVIVKKASDKVNLWLEQRAVLFCPTPCVIFKEDVAMGDVINLNSIYKKDIGR